jgi:hypothetical protein
LAAFLLALVYTAVTRGLYDARAHRVRA